MLQVLLLAAIARVDAQAVRGRVVDADARTPIPAVQINASGPASVRTLSDSAGLFRLDLTTSGSYTIRAERIGYQTVSHQLTATLRENLIVEIKMSPNAIPLEPITIVGRSNVNRTGLEGFYQRAEWSDKIGLGTIIRRSDIDKRAAARTAHLFTASSGSVVRGDTVRFRRGGQPCRPEVFIDGVRGTPGLIDVEIQSIEGIEMYRGPSQMPAEFLDRTGCGSVLIWTRRTETQGRPISLWKIVAGAGFVVGVIFLARR